VSLTITTDEAARRDLILTRLSAGGALITIVDPPSKASLEIGAADLAAVAAYLSADLP
jgi:hypothetical protein